MTFTSSLLDFFHFLIWYQDCNLLYSTRWTLATLTVPLHVSQSWVIHLHLVTPTLDRSWSKSLLQLLLGHPLFSRNISVVILLTILSRGTSFVQVQASLFFLIFMKRTTYQVVQFWSGFNPPSTLRACGVPPPSIIINWPRTLRAWSSCLNQLPLTDTHWCHGVFRLVSKFPLILVHFKIGD